MPGYRRGNRGAPRYETIWASDPDHAFVALTVMGWINRLLTHEKRLDHPLAALLVWLLDEELETLLDRLLPRQPEERGNIEEIRVDEEGGIPDEAWLGRPIRRPNRARTRALVRLSCNNNPRLSGELKRAMDRRREALNRAGRTPLRANLKRVRSMFGFSPAEGKLFLLSYLAATCPPLDNLFSSRLGHMGPPARRFLALLLGIGQKKAHDTLTGRFPKLGLLAHPGQSIAMDSSYWVLLEESPKALMDQNAFRVLPNNAPPLEDYEVPEPTLRFLLDLLQVRPADGSAHVLLAGPAGWGKTSLVQALAARAGVRAFEVARHREEFRRSRDAALTACLHMTNHGEGSVVVVDDADDLLATERGFSMTGRPQDYSHLNHLLDQPGARIIFVVNSLAHISQAVLRRFAFILHMPEPGRRQRRKLWRAVVHRHQVGDMVGEAAITGLAADFPVTAGLMDRALTAALNAGQADPGRFIECVRLTLNGHLEATGKISAQDAGEDVAEEFTLKGLNVSSSLEALISDLKAFDQHLRDGEGYGPRAMTLLLSGPPGTGKSESARHFGDRLDRELMVLRASDLLDKFVGETEKKIARTFRRAESSGAILVFDEADSLLFSREAAVRSWEVSFTNEFLTRMERFRGVMVCTTNRLQGLDHASLRRFTHKMAFDYLTADGNEVFYQQYFVTIGADEFSDGNRHALRRLRSLAPGDFKVVRDRFAFREAGTVTHAMLIEALAEEARYKTDHAGRTAGFGRQDT